MVIENTKKIRLWQMSVQSIAVWDSGSGGSGGDEKCSK